MTSNSASTEHFFRDLRVFETFEEAVNDDFHSELPDDWWIIISDVRGSTKAIESGKYRAVNTVGGATIIAVINVNREVEVPYVFGGDGATLAIPPSMLVTTKKALLGAQKLSRESFGLDLRIGMISVSELGEHNQQVKMGKMRVSEFITQASLSGGGWDYAEKLIKDPETRDRYEVKETAGLSADADFTGFECRWQGVRSRSDHKICILVMAREGDIAAQRKLYDEVTAKILEIYGGVESHHPLNLDQMKLDLNPFKLMGEAKLRSEGGFFARLCYAVKASLLNLIGIFLFKKNIDTEAVQWSRYRQDLVSNSDYRKFDGMLKMVLDGSNDQKEMVSAYLQKRYDNGELFYGIHTAPEALITCLIFSYNGDHAHFVDGSDGGYAIAAKMLKEQIKTV